MTKLVIKSNKNIGKWKNDKQEGKNCEDEFIYKDTIKVTFEGEYINGLRTDGTLNLYVKQSIGEEKKWYKKFEFKGKFNNRILGKGILKEFALDKLKSKLEGDFEIKESDLINSPFNDNCNYLNGKNLEIQTFNDKDEIILDFTGNKKNGLNDGFCKEVHTNYKKEGTFEIGILKEGFIEGSININNNFELKSEDKKNKLKLEINKDGTQSIQGIGTVTYKNYDSKDKKNIVSVNILKGEFVKDNCFPSIKSGSFYKILKNDNKVIEEGEFNSKCELEKNGKRLRYYRDILILKEEGEFMDNNIIKGVMVNYGQNFEFKIEGTYSREIKYKEVKKSDKEFEEDEDIIYINNTSNEKRIGKFIKVDDNIQDEKYCIIKLTDKDGNKTEKNTLLSNIRRKDDFEISVIVLATGKSLTKRSSNKVKYTENFEGKIIVDGNNLKYESNSNISSTCEIVEQKGNTINKYIFNGKFNPELNYPYLESGCYTRKTEDYEFIFESSKFDSIFPNINCTNVEKTVKMNGEIKERYIGGIKNSLKQGHGIFFQGIVDKKLNPIKGLQYIGNFNEDNKSGLGIEMYVDNYNNFYKKEGTFKNDIFKEGIIEQKKDNYYFKSKAKIESGKLIFDLKTCRVEENNLCYIGSLNSEYLYNGNGKQVKTNETGEEIEILEGEFLDGKFVNGTWKNKLEGFERKGKFIYNEKGERLLNDENGEIILFNNETNEIEKIVGEINENKPTGYVQIEKLDKKDNLTDEKKKYYKGEVVKWNHLFTNVKFYYNEYFKN